MKLLKLKEGEVPFDYNTGPSIIHFDARGVVVDDTQVEKLTNMFPLIAVDVEEQTPVIEEEIVDAASEMLDVPEVEETPKKRVRKTNK